MRHSEIRFENPPALPTPLSAYSHVAVVGNLVFVSGQLPLAANGDGMRIDLDAGQQTQMVLTYVRDSLESVGLGMSDVVKTTVYVADLSDYSKVNAAYAEAFGDHRPSRATIQAGALIGDARVEIEAVAAIE